MAENDTQKTGPDLGSELLEPGSKILADFEEKKLEFCKKCGFNPDQVDLKITPPPKQVTYYGDLRIQQALPEGKQFESKRPLRTKTELLDTGMMDDLDLMIETSDRTREFIENALEKSPQRKDLLEDKAFWIYSCGGEKTFFIRVGKKNSEGRFELVDEATGASMTDAIKALVKKWQT